jgi:hypothetical protein
LKGSFFTKEWLEQTNYNKKKLKIDWVVIWITSEKWAVCMYNVYI